MSPRLAALSCNGGAPGAMDRHDSQTSAGVAGHPVSSSAVSEIAVIELDIVDPARSTPAIGAFAGRARGERFRRPSTCRRRIELHR